MCWRWPKLWGIACTLLIVGLLIPISMAAQTAEPTLVVSGFTFAGNDSFNAESLERHIQDAIGRPLTLFEVLEQAERVTAFYRARGFVVARAVVPVQEVIDGIVRIDVLEGRYGRVLLNNLSRLRDETAGAFLQNLRSGDPITNPQLERATLLLNDLPGVAAETYFVAGEAVGTTDVAFAVADQGRRAAFSLSVDNHSSTAFQPRLGAVWFNPSRYGDQWTVNIGPVSSGSLSGNVAYAVPLGGQGLSASLAYGFSERRQPLLGGIEVHTTNRTPSARLRYPVVRTPARSIWSEFTYDTPVERQTIAGILAEESRLSRATLLVRGEHVRSGGSRTTYSLSATHGTLGLAPQSVADGDAAGPARAGAFTRINLMAGTAHEALGGTLTLSARGQLAGKNLHTSEKLSVAGPGAVRAYASGAASGDQGWLMHTEWSKQLRLPRVSAAGSWRIFADMGGVHVNRNSWPGAGGDTHVFLAGVGAGLTLVRGSWTMDLQGAIPVGPTPAGVNNRSGRLWLQTTWRY